MTLGARLALARRRAGLSVGQAHTKIVKIVGDDSPMRGFSVLGIEGGDVFPTSAELLAMAMVYGVRMRWLETGELEVSEATRRAVFGAKFASEEERLQLLVLLGSIGDPT